MWILATWGAIMPAERKPGTTAPGDTRDIQVRVRRHKDAVYFREHYLRGTVDFDAEIVTQAGTDYDARLYIHRDSLATALATMAMDIDYHTFKSQTEKKHGDKQLHSAYVAVWQALYDRLSTRKAFTRPRTTQVWRPTGDTTRWTKRTEKVEHTTTEWKRIADMTDREFNAFMALEDLGKDEPSREDLEAIEAEFPPIVDVKPSFMGVGPREITDDRGSHLDHTYCKHAHTKTARRTCRRAWLKEQEKK